MSYLTLLSQLAQLWITSLSMCFSFSLSLREKKSYRSRKIKSKGNKLAGCKKTLYIWSKRNKNNNNNYLATWYRYEDRPTDRQTGQTAAAKDMLLLQRTCSRKESTGKCKCVCLGTRITFSHAAAATAATEATTAGLPLELTVACHNLTVWNVWLVARITATHAHTLTHIQLCGSSCSVYLFSWGLEPPFFIDTPIPGFGFDRNAFNNFIDIFMHGSSNEMRILGITWIGSNRPETILMTLMCVQHLGVQSTKPISILSKTKIFD